MLKSEREFRIFYRVKNIINRRVACGGGDLAWLDVDGWRQARG